MSDDIRQAISRRVFVARTQAGLTQEQLAEAIERSVEAVSNIERGLSLPTIDTLERIARACSTPLHLFFEDNTSRSRKGANTDAMFELSAIVSDLGNRDVGLLVTMAKAMKGAAS